MGICGRREKERGRVQNRTEETRSWDLHVFIAEVLQIWIMQILSLQNKNKKATFAIPSINFLTSQKHPPLSNFILIYFYFNPQIMFLIFYLTNLIQPKGKSLINLLCFKTWIIIYLITEFVFDFDWV